MLLSQGVLWSAAAVPLFLFCSLFLDFSFHPLSAAQPHSHSSSLSSVELVSASDDIHRFSPQVLYLVVWEHLRGDSSAYCFSPQSEQAWTDSMRMSTYPLAPGFHTHLLSFEKYVGVDFYPKAYNFTRWWRTEKPWLDRFEIPGVNILFHHLMVVILPKSWSGAAWLESSETSSFPPPPFLSSLPFFHSMSRHESRVTLHCIFNALSGCWITPQPGSSG